MNNFKRITAALILAISLVVSAIPFGGAVKVEAATLIYSKESNSGTRGVVCTTLDGTGADKYYTGNYTYDKLDDLSGDALFNALQKLMTDTHTYLSKYDDCHYKADKTDCEQNNGKVTLIYTSYQATMEQWNGWNREHVWPQSLGGDSTKGGGADMHHIRPSDKGVNSSRGNKKYGNSNGGKEKYGTNPAVGILGGTYSSTYFEPNDNVKGDVARICLYMYVRWNSDWGCDRLEKVFESVEVLLEWCENDPVDTWEMGRNEVIGELQGNRNVFIDYPELAWIMLGYDVPESMTTPSGKASAGAPDCPHTATEIKDAVSPTCGKGGYSGDTYCKSCNKKIAAGKTLGATGKHSFDVWETVGGKQKSTCTVCGTEGEREAPTCDHASTEAVGAFDPTCSKEGYSGDTCCKDCGSIISEGEAIPKTDEHKKTVVRNEEKATCGKDGYSGDSYCADCNTLIGQGQTVPATGEHFYIEGEVVSEPTKKESGLRIDTCVNCGNTVGVVLPATGGDNTEVIIICVAAAAVCAAAVATVIVIKKRKIK